GGRVTRLVARHGVYVGGFETGVCDRLAHRLTGHRKRGSIRGPHMRRLAHPYDAVLISKRSHRLFFPWMIAVVRTRAVAHGAGCADHSPCVRPAGLARMSRIERTARAT